MMAFLHQISCRFNSKQCDCLSSVQHQNVSFNLQTEAAINLPDNSLSITRVSALLLYGILPHGKYTCRLPAHSLCFLITDLLPVSALFPVDVICYILLYSVTAHLTASYSVSLSVYAACIYSAGRLISPSIFAESYSTPFVSMA